MATRRAHLVEYWFSFATSVLVSACWMAIPGKFDRVFSFQDLMHIWLSTTSTDHAFPVKVGHTDSTKCVCTCTILENNKIMVLMGSWENCLLFVFENVYFVNCTGRLTRKGHPYWLSAGHFWSRLCQEIKYVFGGWFVFVFPFSKCWQRVFPFLLVVYLSSSWYHCYFAMRNGLSVCPEKAKKEYTGIYMVCTYIKRRK